MLLKIIEKKGNLFDSSCDAYMHGCNTKGKMGAGIAKDFASYYPKMFEDYKTRCRKGTKPGSGYIYYRKEKPHIINLMTQDLKGGAQITYLENSFEWLSKNVPSEEIKSIAMPKIASELGGLDWQIVKDILVERLKFNDIELEIWGR